MAASVSRAGPFAKAMIVWNYCHPKLYVNNNILD